MGTPLDHHGHEPCCPCAGPNARHGSQVPLLRARRFCRRDSKGGGGHGCPPRVSTKTEGDVRKGFVYRRVPHITLKSIAQNEEIDGIYRRYQGQLDELRASLNKLAKRTWQEWEVPRDLDTSLSPQARKAHEEWWQLRRARQKEIDDSIARRADTEFLYDQPYEDTKRIRVSGPFTVESLSPHRVLSTEEERPAVRGLRREAGQRRAIRQRHPG